MADHDSYGDATDALAVSAPRTPVLADVLASRTLVEIVGALTQARYAAAHTSDRRLRRELERLVASAEACETTLRRYIAAALEVPGGEIVPAAHRAHRWIAAATAGASAVAASAAVTTLAVR